MMKEMEDKEFKRKFETLVPVEKKYFCIMNSKSGVLYITDKPGVAKSAIARSIAKKMGYNYVDIRLSMIDETDIGLYPDKSVVNIDGKDIAVLDFIIPRWAVETKKQPTIIHFSAIPHRHHQI